MVTDFMEIVVVFPSSGALQPGPPFVGTFAGRQPLTCHPAEATSGVNRPGPDPGRSIADIRLSLDLPGPQRCVCMGFDFRLDMSLTLL